MGKFASSLLPTYDQVFDEFLTDHRAYCAACLKIRAKNGAIVPLVLNGPQLYGHRLLEEQRAKTGRVRAYWLKGRQQGASTYITSRHFRRIVTDFGKRAAILTHEQQGTDNLFEIVNRYYKHLPDELKPHAGNASAKELYFDRLDSGYLVATAGTKGTGRSATVQFFHGSEMAHWPNAKEHLAGIGQTVPNEDDTEIIFESTAYGVGNVFHQGWQLAVAGQGDFIAVFTPWFWSQEYRREPPKDFQLEPEEIQYAEAFGLDEHQMYWRRLKIKDDFQDDPKLFDQEYPASPEHAFLSSTPNTLIKPLWVARARKSPIFPDANAPKLWGLDVAEYGDDRSCLAKRQGRVITDVKYWSKIGPMELVGKVAMEYEKEPDPKPAHIMVDVTGVGTGPADRLIELGLPVIRVHFGEKAHDDATYRLRRDEMAGEMKEWFENTPNRVPDSDELQQDLTAITFSKDSSMRVVVASSEKLKRKGIKSPDGFWACALTFAYKFQPAARMRIRRDPPSIHDWRTM